MKANEFVKKFGWEKAKRVIALVVGESWADCYNIKDDSIGTAGTIYSKKLCENNENFVCLRDLKRLVNSHELVEKVGGLENAKTFDRDCMYCISHLTDLDSLKNAIADVESCQ